MTVEIACDMSALGPDERERHAAARDTWGAAVLERSGLDEGLDGPEMVFRLTGPAGTKAFLERL